MVTDEKGIEEINPYFTSLYHIGGRVTFRGYGIDSIETFLNDVVQVEEGAMRIEELEEKRSTFRQSVIPTAILEGIHESLRENGEWVEIKNE